MGLCLTSSRRVRRYVASGLWGSGCLHEYLEQNAEEQPRALALVDPQNRREVAAGDPVQLTQAEAADAVRRLGLVFAELGLEPGDLIAIQLPQIVEAPLAMLAAARAGLVACLVPPIWGAREVQSALRSIAPRAILSWDTPGNTSSRLQGLRHVAAALPSIRFLLAIAETAPDGVIPLGQFAAESLRKSKKGDTPADVHGASTDANDVAFVTWSAAEAGSPRGLARSHNELKASGLAIANLAGLEDGGRLLCPYPLAGYPALAAFLVPWLLTAGTLAFHRTESLAGFRAALASAPAAFTAVPARLEASIAGALSGLGRRSPGVVAVMRDLRLDPAYVPAAAAGLPPLVDIVNLGDTALHADWRGQAGPLSIAKVRRREDDERGLPMLETHLAPPRPDDPPEARELFVRSPMSPSAAISEGAGAFAPMQDAEGFVATGLLARASGNRLVPSMGDRSTAIARGAFALRIADVRRLYGTIPGVAAAAIETVSDPVVGRRIRALLSVEADCGLDEAGVRDWLAAAGAGPLYLADDIRISAAANEAGTVSPAAGGGPEAATATRS